MKKLIRKCPICNNEYGEVCKTIRMQLPQGVKLPNEYDVVTCKKCGFAYADVDASQEIYNTYYACSNMYSADAALKEKIVNATAKKRGIFFEKNVSKKAKILDIGCGAGALLTELENRGFCNLFGMDPSPESVNIIREHGINAKIGNVFDEVSQEFAQTFDIVCFTAVLEHVYDLNGCIEHLEKYLAKGGGLYLSVPSVEEFGKKYRPRAHYFNHEHINYFSPVSLDNLMGQHGFCISERQTDEHCCEMQMLEQEMDISCLYEYAGNGVKDQICKDQIARDSILKYIEMEKENEEKTYNRILDFVTSSKQKIIIWGTGAYTLQMIANIPQLSDRVLFFVDSNPLKIGKTIAGKEVVSPLDIVREGCEYPIMICAMRGAKDIEKRIHEMNIKNQYIVI